MADPGRDLRALTQSNALFDGVFIYGFARTYRDDFRREYPLLFANDLDQHTLLAPAIKLDIENLLPGAEIKAAVDDGDDDFAAHDLAFDVGVRVVLARVVVAVLVDGFVRDEALEEIVVVLQEAALVIINV